MTNRRLFTANLEADVVCVLQGQSVMKTYRLFTASVGGETLYVLQGQ